MNTIEWILLGFAASMLILSAWLVVWVTRARQKFKISEWQWMRKIDNNKAMAPLRVSAAERLVIMLERIHPDSLVLRQNISLSNAAMLQLEMVKGIREEFEHNVSLQIYLSEECWGRVKFAKDQVLEIIKVAYTRVKPESSGMELSMEIFKLSASLQGDPVKIAISSVRRELAAF